MSSPKGLLWIAVSGGVSLGVAIYMYATKNGRALRRDIKRKKNLLMNKTNEVLEEGKKKTKRFIKKAQRHSEEFAKMTSAPENYLVPAKKKIKNIKRPY